MSEHTPEEPPAGSDVAAERARDPEEPGAHSGAESQAQERVVPGTAGAAEGYQPDAGTAAGDALAGVEVPADGEEEAARRRSPVGHADDLSEDGATDR